MTAEAVSGSVRAWLRLEGLIAFLFAANLYAAGHHSWGFFALMFFVPDVSFAGYLAGPRAGALIYNMAHSHVGPLTLAAALVAGGRSLEVPLIWAAHVGFDRALGYGLKYPTAFADTHLGRIGRRPPAAA